MNQFSTLPIWDDSKLYNQLEWYFKVATNVMPAKYLIASQIPIEVNLETKTEKLQIEFDRLYDLFLDLKLNIEETGKNTIEIVSPNLLDLVAELANRMLLSCDMCNWNCKVDRTVIETDTTIRAGICQLGTSSYVASYFHHRGEELIFRGVHGSGTIFFASCNMRCGFCQNGDISKDKFNGTKVDADELMEIISILAEEGCHNTNFVGGDPLIHLHTILGAIAKLPLWKRKDHSNKLYNFKSDYFMKYSYQPHLFDNKLNTAILWNSNFYLSESSRKMLRVVTDIWLPDLKFYPDECARRLSKTSNYFETVSTSIKVLYDLNENICIRHLVMPNHVECCSIPILDWINENVSNILINIMGQYHPDSNSDPNSKDYNNRYEDINRFPTNEEIDNVLNYAKELGLNYEIVSRF